MNYYLSHLERAKKGEYIGLKTLPFVFSNAINNIQRKQLITVLGASKSYKSKWTDYTFLLNPYVLNPTATMRGMYFSWEMSLLSKINEWIAFFFWHDYKIKYTVSHIAHRGKLKVADHHLSFLEEILNKRIIPLIGDYDDTGKKVKDGKISFIEQRYDPYEYRDLIFTEMEKFGTFHWEEVKIKEKKISICTRYVPYNTKDYFMVYTDHIRKYNRPDGYTDLLAYETASDLQVQMRNLTNCTFVNIVHSNQGMISTERRKSDGKFIRPMQNDVAGATRFVQDCDLLVGLFNPYLIPGMLNHFGHELINFEKGYLSAHIIANREGVTDDFFFGVDGGNSQFFSIPYPDDPKYEDTIKLYALYRNSHYGVNTITMQQELILPKEPLVPLSEQVTNV